MASIEKRYNKAGFVIAYRITVYDEDSCDAGSARHRMTWRPEPGMSDKQIEKALAGVVEKFEKEIKAGFRTDNCETFSGYADYVMELKEKAGLAPRTLERYLSMLPRINAAIGHLRLTQIRPQHLNELYSNLAEVGVRSGNQKAMLKIDVLKELKRQNISVTRFAFMTNLGESTIRGTAKNRVVSLKTAEAIALGLKKDDAKVYKSQGDFTPLSNKTILEHHRLISSILSQAEKEMLVTYNAASKATPPKARRKAPDYYQPDELQEIIEGLEKAPLKWKAITYLLIDTGCRRGEAVGLKWSCVDLNTGIISIERTLQYISSVGVYEGPTKTGKTRVIRIAPQTVELLKLVREDQKRRQKVYGSSWIETGFVFTKDNGDLLSPDSVTQWLNKFSAANNLPHLHPHAFRHTVASTMIAAGVDLVTTAGELGHASASTTANFYAHEIATAKAKASQVRANVFDTK